MLLLNRYIRPAAKLCVKEVYCVYKSCAVFFGKNGCRKDCSLRQWFFLLAGLLTLIVYFKITVFKESNVRPSNIFRNISLPNITRDINEYKYMLINGTEVTMKQESIQHLQSSYAWFVSMKHLFKNLGEDEAPAYQKDTPICKINMSSLGNYYMEQTHTDVKLGGFYAPTHCRSSYRIAIFVPYRNRAENLPIFLYYIHRLLKKHLLEYRIFVIEQFGTEMFNRGKLFNIAFLESQRFGTWDCLVFHDVDAIPEDDRIIYNCSRSPFHIASAIDEYGYSLRYEEEFGGVTALTPAHYETVNGYSNFYWNWGGEDDDMSARLKFMNLSISRYDNSIARFSTLPHEHNAAKGQGRVLFLLLCRQRFQLEGLKTTNYKLITAKKKKFFTHLVVDVNPEKLKLDEKNLLRQMTHISGGDISGYRRTFLIHKVTKPTSPVTSPLHKSQNNTTVKNKDVKLN